MRLSHLLTSARYLVFLGVLCGFAAPAAAQADRELNEALLREMIGFRSTADHPDETLALLEGVVTRLVAAGFDPTDMEMVTVNGVANLVVRYRGSGAAAPVLTMAHVDVVDAEPEAWREYPYQLAEIDGYYYGRGTTDNKAGAASLVANFIRLRGEGFEPARDIIMVLTGDEESTQRGIGHLATERLDLLGAEIALNTDAGFGRLDSNGEPQGFYVQTSEKLYQSFVLETTNPGGHSSVPRADNAIYELAAALTRIAEHEFPIELSDGTRGFFRASARFERPEVAELMERVAAAGSESEAARELAAYDAYFNANLRTTCVATQLDAGHAENALPRSARATVNCRILPGHTPDEIEAVLRQVVRNDSISFRRVDVAFPSDPSPWSSEVAATFEALVGDMWRGTPVIPSMSNGATDGLWVRNAGIPVYGASAIFERDGDDRAHGLDERILVEAYHDAVEFWYRLLRRVAG
jgi:acetylornithine deacetylase/succinyl-diaminopimelate desuccinylase-like protein